MKTLKGKCKYCGHKNRHEVDNNVGSAFIYCQKQECGQWVVTCNQKLTKKELKKQILGILEGYFEDVIEKETLLADLQIEIWK